MSHISKLKIKNRIKIVPLNNGNLKIFNGSLSQKKYTLYWIPIIYIIKKLDNNNLPFT